MPRGGDGSVPCLVHPDSPDVCVDASVQLLNSYPRARNPALVAAYRVRRGSIRGRLILIRTHFREFVNSGPLQGVGEQWRIPKLLASDAVRRRGPSSCLDVAVKEREERRAIRRQSSG